MLLRNFNLNPVIDARPAGACAHREWQLFTQKQSMPWIGQTTPKNPRFLTKHAVEPDRWNFGGFLVNPDHLHSELQSLGFGSGFDASGQAGLPPGF